MQKIPFFFILFCAYTVPTVIAAGRDGGTTMVTISRLLRRISLTLAFRET